MATTKKATLTGQSSVLRQIDAEQYGRLRAVMAARGIERPATKRWSALLFVFMAGDEGRTFEEVCHFLHPDKSHLDRLSTARATLTHLHGLGLIDKTERKRRTLTAQLATVYVFKAWLRLWVMTGDRKLVERAMAGERKAHEERIAKLAAQLGYSNSKRRT